MSVLSTTPKIFEDCTQSCIRCVQDCEEYYTWLSTRTRCSISVNGMRRSQNKHCQECAQICKLCTEECRIMPDN